MAETLIVVNKVKKLVRMNGLRTGGDFLEKLSDKVFQMVSSASEKVKLDGKRKTLGAEDL